MTVHLHCSRIRRFGAISYSRILRFEAEFGHRLDTIPALLEDLKYYLQNSSVPIKVNEQDIPDGFTVFTAASGDQTAKPLPEVEQGLFSYFLMKGLEGDLTWILMDKFRLENFTSSRKMSASLSGITNTGISG